MLNVSSTTEEQRQSANQSSDDNDYYHLFTELIPGIMFITSISNGSYLFRSAIYHMDSNTEV